MGPAAVVKAGRGSSTIDKATGVCRASKGSGGVGAGLRPVPMALGDGFLSRAD